MSSSATPADLGTMPPRPASVSSASEPFQLLPFLKATVQELPKLNRPTGLQVLANTIIVVMVATLTTLFLWGIDKLFYVIIHWITPARG
ncbi:MAG: preprotein translocase subunit SecE [Vampirovibrionales bacterium]